MTASSSSTGEDPSQQLLLRQAYRRLLDAQQGPYSAVEKLGSIVLRRPQVHAVGLLQQMLHRYGGALLADDVGTGKTFCALGVAVAFKRVLVVAPAALRDRWRSARDETNLEFAFLSFQTLSRNPHAGSAHEWDLIVVDEAHHVRTRSTRRYAALAALCRRTPILLMSATPLHNRPEDLHALFALFLGSGVRKLSLEHLSPVMLRRRDLAEHDTPEVAPLHWHPVAADPDVLEAVLRIPPPLPAADEGQAAALNRFMLLRQWCSSDAALAASLDRMRRRALILDTELSHGTLPTKRELLVRIAAGDDEQLALNLSVPDEQIDPLSLKRALQRHLSAATATLKLLRRRTSPSASRWQTVAGILESHRSDRAVLFSHSIDTARSCFIALMNTHRLACLDGERARVASGRIARAEVIASFRPGTRAKRAMRIDALIATDVLSEGIDLHDASVLIHLDLPWTMARIEQRLGRLRRIGSPHARVVQHALSPPAAGNGLVRILERLATKAQLAAEHIRDDPVFHSHTRPASFARSRTSELTAQIRSTLAKLATDSTTAPGATAEIRAAQGPRMHTDNPEPRSPESVPVVAAAQVDALDTGAFVAALNDGRLLSGSGDGVSASPEAFVQTCNLTTNIGSRVNTAVAQGALSAIDRWLQVNDILATEDSPVIHSSDAHARVQQLIDATLETGARQHRVEIAAWASRCRDQLAGIRGAGAESKLEQLVAHWNELSHVQRSSAHRQRDMLEQLTRLRRELPKPGPAKVVALVLLTPGPTR